MTYTWDMIFGEVMITSNTHILSAIDSCIEADEPELLRDVIGNDRQAQIYALTKCFMFIPSIRCIEYLIGIGVNMHDTFDNNPFKCTPQEYLNKRFTNNGSQSDILAKAKILGAMFNGKQILKVKELENKLNKKKKVSFISGIRKCFSSSI